jgi:hypothetical protein
MEKPTVHHAASGIGSDAVIRKGSAKEVLSVFVQGGSRLEEREGEKLMGVGKDASKNVNKQKGGGRRDFPGRREAVRQVHHNITGNAW